jgi:hypothetical protein
MNAFANAFAAVLAAEARGDSYWERLALDREWDRFSRMLPPIHSMCFIRWVYGPRLPLGRYGLL